MKNFFICLSLCSCCSLIAACSSRTHSSHECLDPDKRLESLLQPPGGKTPDNARLSAELQRLQMVCPRHIPTLLAVTEIMYDEGDLLTAQRYLDDILALSRKYPAATMLRARIAMREGNFRLARRLLESEIMLVPNNSVLRETLAAAQYLQGEYGEARKSIEAALRLGAPAWRSAYHMGLIEEALGNMPEAAQHYLRAMELKPDWTPATARLEALRASNSFR